jgi:hypothetical protein
MCNSDLILLENNDNVNNYCNLEVIYVKAYEILWPTSGDYNFIATVEYFKENINMEKVKGFLYQYTDSAVMKEPTCNCQF